MQEQHITSCVVPSYLYCLSLLPGANLKTTLGQFTHRGAAGFLFYLPSCSGIGSGIAGGYSTYICSIQLYRLYFSYIYIYIYLSIYLDSKPQKESKRQKHVSRMFSMICSFYVQVSRSYISWVATLFLLPQLITWLADGPAHWDRYWNWFDLVLAAAGIADLTIQFITASSAMVVEESKRGWQVSVMSVMAQELFNPIPNKACTRNHGWGDLA